MNFFITSCDSCDLPPKEHSLNTRENKYGPRPTYLGVHLSQIVQDTVQIKLSCTKNNMFSWLFNLWNRIKNQLNQFVANIKSDWKKKTLDTLRDLEMKFDSWKGPVNIPRLGGGGEGSGDYGRFTWFSGGVEDLNAIPIMARSEKNLAEKNQAQKRDCHLS